MALSADGIRKAFDALSSELRAMGERGEIVVVGGAALVMMFGARETTKDVDAYFVSPPSAMRAAAARVAEHLSLPEDWLNDAAKGFLVGLTTGAVLYQSQFLLARAASAEQLLAMKLAAWRDAIDRGDARLLMSGMSGSMEEVWAAVKPRVPPPQLDKAWYAFQDLWEAVHGTS